MSTRQSNVIPSRADGEGPRKCKLSRLGRSVTQLSARDDSGTDQAEL
jgi:hypothetical protein